MMVGSPKNGTSLAIARPHKNLRWKWKKAEIYVFLFENLPGVDFIYSEAVHAETLLSSKYVESGSKQTLPPVKI